MTTVNGDPSVFIDLTNTGGPGGLFRVRDDATGSAITRFTVVNGGLVVVTNNIERSGTMVLGNTSGSTGDMVSFEQNNTERLKFSWDGSDVELEADSPIALDNASGSNVDIVSFRSSGTERLKVEYDGTHAELATTESMRLVGTKDLSIIFGDTTATTHTLTFIAKDSGGTRRILTTLTEAGIWKFGNDSGTLQAQLEPEDTNDDCHLDLGIGETRGRLTLRRDDGTPKRAGVACFEPNETTAGAMAYVFAWYDYDNSGKLQLLASDTDPAGGPTGTVVILADLS